MSFGSHPLTWLRTTPAGASLSFVFARISSRWRSEGTDSVPGHSRPRAVTPDVPRYLFADGGFPVVVRRCFPGAFGKVYGSSRGGASSLSSVGVSKPSRGCQVLPAWAVSTIRAATKASEASTKEPWRA